MMAGYLLKGKLSGTAFEALPVHAQLATETFALGNLGPSLKQLAIGSTSEPWMAMGFITHSEGEWSCVGCMHQQHQQHKHPHKQHAKSRNLRF